MTPRYSSLSEVQKDLGSGAITLPELVSYYLDNIERSSHLNAFIEVYTDEVKAQAEIVQQKIQSGKAGKLAGAVIGSKANLCYKSHVVTASSKI